MSEPLSAARLAEIKARHDGWKSGLGLPYAGEDIGALLSEVDRLSVKPAKVARWEDGKGADTLTHSGVLIQPGNFYLASNLPDVYDGGAQPFIVSLAHGGPRLAVWGFSVYRHNPGYRTLGLDLREWLERYPGVVVSYDRDRRVKP